MWWHNPRPLLIRGLFLDWFGQLLILFGIMHTHIVFFPSNSFSSNLGGQWLWLLFNLLLYPLLGWLFGTYTVLNWRRLALPILLQRVLIASAASLLVIACAVWLINPHDDVWVVYPRVQLIWFFALTLWSFISRIALRGGLLLVDSPRILLLAIDEEIDGIIHAWTQVPLRQPLEPIPGAELEQLLAERVSPLLVALSPRCRRDPVISGLIDRLELQDPRLVKTISLIKLFELQQGRLPPAILADSALSYGELPWVRPFSFQAQLKRLADLLVAAVLLLITAPFVGLAALLIRLEDRGPVFYTQLRSGWLGRPFTLFKLRTMRVQPTTGQPLWTQPGDQRITLVGQLLRRVRLDELPQLLNVLNGDMSLIGPRPERPELESMLERHLSHYRKRHWMRPGLSGWAQVCAPYASSIDDSCLKLSFDLYYLRNFSIWLDLVILFRTIKTVLKASGR